MRNIIPSFRRLAFLGAGLVLGNNALVAFDGYEHCTVGIYGLYWARLIYDRRFPQAAHRADIDATVNDFLNPIAWEPLPTDGLADLTNGSARTVDKSRRRATFGELVEAVDFIQTPYDCLTSELVFGSASLKVVTNKRVTATADEMNLRQNLQDASREAVTEKLHSLLSLARFSHSNDDHFENRALLQYEQWHQEALRLAGTERNLWKALWIEAFADHFLQDFLAPGHVRTPRNRDLTDVVSLAMHDHFNRVGQAFKVFPGNLPLTDLEYLRRNTDAQETLVSGAVLDKAFGGPKADKAVASERLAFADVATLGEGSFAEPVTLYGDGKLKPDAGEARSFDDMLFVISATGASILDVLEAYDTPGSTRPFDPNLYSWESVFVRRGLWFYHQKIDATMPYGAYHVVNTREEGNDIVYYRAGDGSMAPEQRLVTDQILAFEANYQSMLRQESGSDRVEIIAETLVAGYLSTKPRDVDQLGLLAGYTCLIGRDSWGQGPQLKLVVPVPEIGLQSYIYEGFRWYYNSQGHVGRPFGGIGAETGFGLYFLRVNLSEENYLQGPKIRQTPALSFGLGITITLNRLLHL